MVMNFGAKCWKSLAGRLPQMQLPELTSSAKTKAVRRDLPLRIISGTRSNATVRNSTLPSGGYFVPTGYSKQEKINMAVAIHLGKSDSMSYRHKGFEPNDWLFYQAWLVLKSHRAFLPPTPPPLDEDIEEIEDDEDSDPPSDTASDTSGDSDVQPSMQPSKQRSRGPGYGVKKTKALKKQEGYRAKKHKTQQEYLEIQRQRKL
ncbi:hypothetical protein IV203_037635 [Nitzschia inconspicua]|uniref:Uncharacterized protein n=1 Tax=Nitzschia inconspicua TaxID=303405 RepID=A0A9K3LLB3_9STRA|nr:hypothetical protein IV203_037635 [Nitzschia inconspicua]